MMEFWQQLGQQLVSHSKALWQSIGFRLSLGYLSIFLCGTLLIWMLVSHLLNQLIEETIEEYGNTVAEQLAQSSVDSLVRADLVSLQTQLDNLTRLDTIISAAIYDVENRTLVQAGTTPNARHNIDSTQLRNFPATITFDRSIAGKVIVSLNTAKLQNLQQRLFNSLSLGVVVIILLTIFISYFLGQRANQLYGGLLAKIQNSLSSPASPTLSSPPPDPDSKINWHNLSSSLRSMEDYLDQLQRENPQANPKSSSQTTNSVTKHKITQHQGSYAELLIECTNFENLQQQISHRELQLLLNDFQEKLEKSKILYHGTSFLVAGSYVSLRFYADSADDPAFQAICCAMLLSNLVKQQSKTTMNITLELRMAVHWKEQSEASLPELLKNHIYKNELEELQFLCTQANNGEIVSTKNIKQFPSIAEHIKLELISGVAEIDCYRVTKLSDNYQSLLSRQIKQLA